MHFVFETHSHMAEFIFYHARQLSQSHDLMHLCSYFATVFYEQYVQ